MMLLGFRSPWTKPSPCSHPSGSHSRIASSTASSTAIGSACPGAALAANVDVHHPSAHVVATGVHPIASRSVRPSRSSIATHGTPPSVPWSTIRTMPGCRARASAATSRRIAAARVGPASDTVFSATSSPVPGRRARYTTPMPPRPSDSSNVQPPSTRAIRESVPRPAFGVYPRRDQPPNSFFQNPGSAIWVSCSSASCRRSFSSSSESRFGTSTTTWTW